MPLPQFSMIRLQTDRYRSQGVAAGALGVILDIYGDEAYEVEFTNPDGTSYAWFAVAQDEVAPADEATVAALSTRADGG